MAHIGAATVRSFLSIMFSFLSRNTMSEAPEATPAQAAQTKTAEPHPLDALTGGAFSAATSGERAARIREWLTSDPAADKLQEVFKELSARDKGAARAVRERLDEIRRAHAQEAIAADWAAKAQALLAQPKINIADALAWQRDAAKAGAPLSREPLSQLKGELADRVKAIEDLQHRVQVQREAAVLLAQRIEVLSTKPFGDAQAALEALQADVAHWHEQAGELTADGAWGSVEVRFATQLESSQKQLQLVWEAFSAALAQTAAAFADPAATLPTVPVWADELRAARGQPTEAQQQAAKAEPAPKVDPQLREKARQVVGKALERLQKETTQGHGKASSQAAAALRTALKFHGRFIDGAFEHEVQAALVAAGELEGWQRWSADQIREELVGRAKALLQRPAGQELGGRKMQETLRELREQWKQADQGAPANHGLWKQFDEACNEAHKVVEAWLEKVRSEAVEHRAQRQALIDEVNAWAQAQAASTDWKAQQRSLRQFGDRWRNGGHVSEKVFAELQPLWKQALDAASAPLLAAQKDSLQRRHAMIDEAQALSEGALRIDAVKALQQRWQAEAQAVALDRRQEQKLWDAFRKPIDEAFNRKSAERERSQAAMGAHDRAVLQASKALDAANASGDAQQIRQAMAALEQVMREPAAADDLTADAGKAPAGAPQAGATDADAPVSDQAQGAEPAARPAAPARPVVAVRGDDRPGANQSAASQPAGRAGRSGQRGDSRDGRRDRKEGGRWGERDDRAPRAPRGPRLGDAAFRAQRDALDQAQGALRKLAAQAHGEALTQLLAAWQQRNADLLPSAQELGPRVTGATRNQWGQALSGAAAGVAGEALLRLEMAAEAPTPAEHLAARRALQLQLLTRRNDPSPRETWSQDAARVLASASDEDSARRLRNALKTLLR
ncbi:hypothetical protein GCM10022279_15590 [Comamonas faecalis]|uniref:DUF349 domain-containing protein n=2 Tax=Comamonas faecalis TaxID=1387849 RepID=A0ABP7R7R7_9BURK